MTGEYRGQLLCSDTVVLRCYRSHAALVLDQQLDQHDRTTGSDTDTDDEHGASKRHRTSLSSSYYLRPRIAPDLSRLDDQETIVWFRRGHKDSRAGLRNHTATHVLDVSF